MERNFTFHGNPVTISGEVLEVGMPLPDATLVAEDLSDVSISSFLGQPLIILSIPSLDTPVCVVEARKFSEQLQTLPNTKCLLVSRDLPFAQKRWQKETGINNIIVASDHKYRTFALPFGVLWAERELLARAVFVADGAGGVIYVQYLQEIDAEPDYKAAVEAVRALG